MKVNREHLREREARSNESRHHGEGGTTKAVIIYDSVFGNTEKIAKALARGMEKQDMRVDCFKVDDMDVQKLVEYDFLAIGGPTHRLGLSERMKDFLETLQPVNLNGKQGFCFDTRNQSRFNRFDLNSAAKRIEKTLKRMNVTLIHPRKSAIVEGREGPLEDNIEETFEQLGVEIAKLIQ